MTVASRPDQPKPKREIIGRHPNSVRRRARMASFFVFSLAKI
jgi:hypothetical protein